MKAFARWEREMGFFVLPTFSVETYDSLHFGLDWPRVFGITFLWMKFIVEFEFLLHRRGKISKTE